MNNLKEFSKKLLALDYMVAAVLILAFFICEGINGFYTINTTNQLIQMNSDLSLATITPPFNLDMFGVLLSTWIIQLGVSSGAYYLMCKSDHKIQLPIKLINEMPDDIKQDVDMTAVITTVLNSTDN